MTSYNDCNYFWEPPPTEYCHINYPVPTDSGTLIRRHVLSNGRLSLLADVLIAQIDYEIIFTAFNNAATSFRVKLRNAECLGFSDAVK